MKSVLIAGAKSFISINFVNNFSKDYKFYCVGHNNKINNLTKSKNIKIIYADLSKLSNIKKLPKKIDIILHLAAIPDTFLNKKLAKNQIITNIKITKNIIQYASDSSCNKIIFMSSVYVYSGYQNRMLSEYLKPKPIESLGNSKLACENMLHKMSNKKITIIIFRLFTAYGKFSRKNQFLNFLYRSLKRKKKITLKNSFIKRDYIYVKDINQILKKSIDKINYKQNYNVFNLASGNSITVKKLVNILQKIIGTKKKVEYLNKKKGILKSIGDTSHTSDIKKIKNFFKWKPTYLIKDGLKDLYEKKL